MRESVRRFIRNCDVCGRTTVWREAKAGLLRSLPIPDRIGNELTIDFITDMLRHRGKAFISYSIPSSAPYLVLYTTYPSSRCPTSRPSTIWFRQILYRYTYRVAKQSAPVSYTHFHDPEVKNASRAGNGPMVRMLGETLLYARKICQSATANARGINATRKATKW